MHEQKLIIKLKNTKKFKNQLKPRLSSPRLDDASTTSLSRFPMDSSSSINSSHGRLDDNVSAMPLHDGSARSTNSWSVTILCMMSLRWSFAKTSTILPSLVLSRDRRPSRMWVIHSWLALWPPPCFNKSVEFKSSSRWVRVWIYAWEFSCQNRLSLGSSSPFLFSLTFPSSGPKLPAPPSPSSWWRGGHYDFPPWRNGSSLPSHPQSQTMPALFCVDTISKMKHKRLDQLFLHLLNSSSPWPWWS